MAASGREDIASIHGKSRKSVLERLRGAKHDRLPWLNDHFFASLRITSLALPFFSHEEGSESADLHSLTVAEPMFDRTQNHVDQSRGLFVRQPSVALVYHSSEIGLRHWRSKESLSEGVSG